MSTWKVALPMYAATPELREANAAFLRLFIEALAGLGWREPVRIVEPDFAHIDAHWLDPHLLLSQTCGYPLMTRLNRQVRLLALPSYRAEGFSRSQYSSRLIVRADSGFQTLAELRGAVAVINNQDSHSGMNALRHSVAPLAQGGLFFADVLVSGGHAASIDYVREGKADVAAIDPVTWAHVLDARPELNSQLRTLGWSAPAPGLPLIGSRTLSTEQVGLIRTALSTAMRHDPALANQLRLHGFYNASWSSYQRIVEMQEQAGNVRLARDAA
jgi:ABC-type phosphate/phosphonate transport system substrate-binding protein